MWRGLEVKKIDENMGFGVFAKCDIAPGLIIPYNGKLRRLSSLANPGNHRMSADPYVIDANPRDKECSNNKCIAGLINEAPKHDEQAFYNCKMFDFINRVSKTDEEVEMFSKFTNLPQYPSFSENNMVVYMVMCTIKKGEQLFVNYMGSFERDYEHKSLALGKKDEKEWAKTDKIFNDRHLIEGLVHIEKLEFGKKGTLYDTRVYDICVEEVDETMLEAKTKIRFHPLPLFLGGEWAWEHIYRKDSEKKFGMGVFARHKILPGLLIPYCGVKIKTPPQKKTIKSEHVLPHSNSEYGSIDGDTSSEDPAYAMCKQGLCMGSTVNEANVGEKYNCFYWDFDPTTSRTLSEKPSYPHHGVEVYVVVACTVEADEELLVHYGDGYSKDKKYVSAGNPESVKENRKNTVEWDATRAAVEADD